MVTAITIGASPGKSKQVMQRMQKNEATREKRQLERTHRERNDPNVPHLYESGLYDNGNCIHGEVETNFGCEIQFREDKENRM